MTGTSASMRKRDVVVSFRFPAISHLPRICLTTAQLSEVSKRSFVLALRPLPCQFCSHVPRPHVAMTLHTPSTKVSLHSHQATLCDPALLILSASQRKEFRIDAICDSASIRPLVSVSQALIQYLVASVSSLAHHGPDACFNNCDCDDTIARRVDKLRRVLLVEGANEKVGTVRH